MTSLSNEKLGTIIITLLLGGAGVLSETLTQEICVPFIFILWLGLLIILPIGELIRLGAEIVNNARPENEGENNR